MQDLLKSRAIHLWTLAAALLISGLLAFALLNVQGAQAHDGAEDDDELTDEVSTDEIDYEPSGALPRDETGEPTTGGFTSDNVEYVGFLPFQEGGGQPVPGQPQEILTSTGANIRGDNLYLTSWKSISTYDISNPEEPELTAYRPEEFMFENEDVATNGEILLFSEQIPGDKLHVYDVSDDSKIEEIAVLDGAGDHTMTCIQDCEWAYGSDGSIVDLRDPEDPKLADENWHELTGLNSDGAHDVNEYRDGYLVTSPITDDAQILDVRNPLDPQALDPRAEHPNPEGFLFHSGTWPREGKDKFLLMQGEQNFQTRCDEDQGPFMTFDASDTDDGGDFEQRDTYRVENGTYADGAPTVNALGCSSHWFEAHPTFKNGGAVTLGYYEHGTHFLDVDKQGHIERKGYFLPHAGSTSASYWVTDEIVYAIDYTRGIDILRYTGPGTDGPGKNANQRGNGRG